MSRSRSRLRGVVEYEHVLPVYYTPMRVLLARGVLNTSPSSSLLEGPLSSMVSLLLSSVSSMSSSESSIVCCED